MLYYKLPSIKCFDLVGDQESQALSQSHVNISEIKDNAVQFRSLLDTGEDERRKLRRSRGSNVILDQENVDFPSSPLSSPNHSKHVSFYC